MLGRVPNNGFDAATQRRDHMPGSRFARQFLRDENGNLIIFGVYIFVLIFMVAGIGIDLMRFERDRTRLQYTLDRAVLAAADLDQTLNPDLVVQDYFAKSGMSDYLEGITVTEGLGYRTVSGTATAAVPTQFMHMSGIDVLDAPASATAEERIDAVEISLVLDVSGSMNSNNRLTNLKIAADDFIDEMVANTEDGKLSISIIPYATQVAVPAEVLDEMNVSNEHSYSHCVNFSSNDFNTAGISQASSLQRTMHFDPWTSWGPDNHDGMASGELVQKPICEHDPVRTSMVMQKDAQVLKNYIQSLTARGNTSIDIGMKWGTAMLDPLFQPVVDALITDGTVDAGFDNRPEEYSDAETLKVIVLMTDGQNTSQYYINSGYRTGLSNLWWNPGAGDTGRYSVYNPSSGSYYWPDDDNNDFPDHDTTNDSYGRWEDHPYGNGPGEEGTASRVSYADLWAHIAMEQHLEHFYQPWSGDPWGDWYYDVRNYVGSSTKNTRTNAICNAAKDEDIIVFTIGFEAPSSGEAVLQACASSPAHFFDVNGLEIAEAFSSIASSIRKLRLTQ